MSAAGQSGRWRKAWNQMRWSMLQRGLGGTARVAMRRVFRRRPGETTSRHPFDLRYGVDTGGLIGGGVLASGQANDLFATAYVGISPSQLRHAIELWRTTPGTREIGEYMFLDIGCGKGRAMMLASEFPFRSVGGVELNGELAGIAENNVRIWTEQGLAACSLQVWHGDATELELPRLPLLVYLFNPFQARVLRALLQRLEDAAGEARGVIDVLYLVPEQQAVFDDFPRFQRLWSEVVAISEEDAAADPVATPNDMCNAYRVEGSGLVATNSMLVAK